MQLHQAWYVKDVTHHANRCNRMVITSLAPISHRVTRSHLSEPSTQTVSLLLRHPRPPVCRCLFPLLASPSPRLYAAAEGVQVHLHCVDHVLLLVRVEIRLAIRRLAGVPGRARARVTVRRYACARACVRLNLCARLSGWACGEGFRSAPWGPSGATKSHDKTQAQSSWCDPKREMMWR